MPYRPLLVLVLGILQHAAEASSHFDPEEALPRITAEILVSGCIVIHVDPMLEVAYRFILHRTQ